MDCHFCLTAQLGAGSAISRRERLSGKCLSRSRKIESILLRRRTSCSWARASRCSITTRRCPRCRSCSIPRAVALAPRHVTLSTSGIVPGIERLGQGESSPEPGDFTECFKRRAAERADANQSQVSAGRACSARARNIHCARAEYITFEYVLLGGVNDAPEDARRVVRLVCAYSRKSEFDPLESREFAVPRAPTRGKHRSVSAHPRGQGRPLICALLAAGRTSSPRLRPARTSMEQHQVRQIFRELVRCNGLGAEEK